METFIYKLKNIKHFSGALYGPITPIYGIGSLIIIFLSNLIYKNQKIHKYLKPVLLFFSSVIILTLIEFIGGHLVHFLFGKDLWNYQEHRFNIGKYISLEIAFCWGIMALIFIYILKPFMERFIKRIPKLATYIFTIIFILDIIVSIIYKR